MKALKLSAVIACLVFGSSASGTTYSFDTLVGLPDEDTHWDEYLYLYTPGSGWTGENLTGNNGVSNGVAFSVAASDGSTGQSVDVRAYFHQSFEATFFTLSPDAYPAFLDPAYFDNFGGLSSVTVTDVRVASGSEPLYDYFTWSVIWSITVGEFVEYLPWAGHPSVEVDGMTVIDPSKPAAFTLYVRTRLGIDRLEIVKTPDAGSAFAMLGTACITLAFIRRRIPA
jgi:hypothetical protein